MRGRGAAACAASPSAVRVRHLPMPGSCAALLASRFAGSDGVLRDPPMRQRVVVLTEAGDGWKTQSALVLASAVATRHV